MGIKMPNTTWAMCGYYEKMYTCYPSACCSKYKSQLDAQMGSSNCTALKCGGADAGGAGNGGSSGGAGGAGKKGNLDSAASTISAASVLSVFLPCAVAAIISHIY